MSLTEWPAQVLRLLSSTSLPQLVAFGTLFALLERVRPARTTSDYWKAAVFVDVGAFIWVSVTSRSIDAVARWIHGALEHDAAMVLASAPAPARIALYILLADFGAYWVHRALHRPLLWRAHKWHHSIEQLNWFSGYRGSLLQNVVMKVPYLLVFWMVGFDSASQIFVIATIFVFNQGFLHLNSTVRLGPLAWIVVTPQFHRVHHHVNPTISCRNLGFIFSFWDWLFGTYVDPDSLVDDFPLGLEERESHVRMAVGV